MKRSNRKADRPLQKQAPKTQPVLAKQLLTAEQRSQDKFEVVLSREQKIMGKALMKQQIWNLDGMSWFNLTELD